MSNSAVAVEIIRAVEREKGDRGNFESLWTQAARRVFPRGDNFQGRNPSPGQRRTEWQFDSKPALALERFAAVFLAMTMPSSERYHSFHASERIIRKLTEVMRWCEVVRDEAFNMRYSFRSNFVGQINEVLMSYGAFGTGLMFLDDRLGKPANYKSLDLALSWIREGEDGKVNQIYRQLNLCPDQSIEMFGANNLPDQIVNAAEKEPNKTFVFYQRIIPRKIVNRNLRFSPESMAFQSDYVCELEKRHLETGGYRVFPVAVARATTQSNEVYGRSPAMTVLADIKMKNEVWRTVIRSAHRMAEPVMLLADDAALAPFQMQPGHRNKGYIKSSDGTALAQQLKWEGDLNPAMMVAQAADEDIKDAFLMRVFELMLTNPDMTATEVLERIRERGILLTPSAGRFFGEFVGTLTMRERDILQARGKLEEPPEQLQRYGGEIEPVDNSPLARAQKAERAIGFERTVQQLAPFAERDPKVLSRFNMNKIVPELADIHGTPAEWLYSDQEMADIAAQDAAQEAAMQAAAAAPGLASAAKDAAQANLFMQQAGGNT